MSLTEKRAALDQVASQLQAELEGLPAKDAEIAARLKTTITAAKIGAKTEKAAARAVIKTLRVLVRQAAKALGEAK